MPCNVTNHHVVHRVAQFYKTEKAMGDRTIDVLDFSIENIVKSLLAEKRKVVFLMTASLDYGFGKAQLAMLRALKDAFPTTVVDVCLIGHCMYGCPSCSLSEHKIPIYVSSLSVLHLCTSLNQCL